jgi:hypothetical protein
MTETSVTLFTMASTFPCVGSFILDELHMVVSAGS